MKAKWDIEILVKEYNELLAKEKQIHRRLVEIKEKIVKDYDILEVWIVEMSIVNRPSGKMRMCGDEWVDPDADGNGGTYYHKIDGKDKYFSYRYKF